MDLVPTFLGAHAVPAEWAADPDGYVDEVIGKMLPAVCGAGSPLRPAFFDVFCEEGAFSLEQTRRLLKAARQWGLGLKVHADEFSSLGGAGLAAELGAVSADHLACTPPRTMDAHGCGRRGGGAAAGNDLRAWADRTMPTRAP